MKTFRRFLPSNRPARCAPRMRGRAGRALTWHRFDLAPLADVQRENQVDAFGGRRGHINDRRWCINDSRYHVNIALMLTSFLRAPAVPVMSMIEFVGAR